MKLPEIKNRERKYRVWTGYKMEYNVMVGFLGAFYVQGMSETDSACMSSMNTKYDDSRPVMEYTGLKDKDGREIWQSDVIEYSFDGVRLKAWIIWNDYIGQWQYQYHGALGGTPSDMLWNLLSNTRFPKEVTVIGNIYENPDSIISE